ncbi:MAG: CPBP family intramembrane metalloprotease, partial [Anaerolineaceae bacterium]|nr:CPBP family intramembrane metalloprotease [Anaerolineaceae bacterium]
MREKLLNNTIKSCLLIFLILITVHAFEAIVLRMDETVFAENFINKFFGIAVIAIVLRILGWKWSDIGFCKKNFLKNTAAGFLLAIVSFAAAYSAESLILKAQGNQIRFGFFTTGFSLTGDAVIQQGIRFILMCVFFNIINVIMEEGTFRGLFYGILKTDHSAKTALLIQALLFGVWHIITPLHNLIDGDIDFAAFAGLGIGYIILAGIMGGKWSLMYRMTGSLYSGMADHFFNNCIATNLLHVTTGSGTDELMIVRVLIAQILSFIIV